MNEYELVYLYQENNSTKILLLLLQRFTKKMSSIQAWIYRKYFFLPLEENDLSCFKYLAIKECATHYVMTSRLSFQTYLLKYFSWIINKYLHKFVSFKHRMLNLANYAVYESAIGIANNPSIITRNYSKLSFFSYLSLQEKRVFWLWFQNMSIKEICVILELKYRQVDNAKQRIIKKINKFRSK